MTQAIDLNTLLAGLEDAGKPGQASLFQPIAPQGALFESTPIPQGSLFAAPAPNVSLFSAPAAADPAASLAPQQIETIVAKVEGEANMAKSYEQSKPAKKRDKVKKEAVAPEQPIVKPSRKRAEQSEIVLKQDGDSVDVSQLVEGMPVKQQEKAKNLIAFLTGGATPSVYAQTALKLLVAKGSLTSIELRDELLKKYKPGTAASQTQQMMHVLSKLGCASGDGRSIALEANSLIVAKFQAEYKGSL